MKYKPSPRLKKIVKEAAAAYLGEINCGNIQLDVHYMDADKEVAEKKGETVMEIFADYRYQRANMYVYPCAEDELKKKGVEEVRRVIAHEICHILTWPLYDLAGRAYKSEGEVDDANEALTEILSRYVYNTVKPNL